MASWVLTKCNNSVPVCLTQRSQLQAVREYEEQYQTVWREQQEAALAGISAQLPGALLPSPLVEPASMPLGGRDHPCIVSRLLRCS